MKAELSQVRWGRVLLTGVLVAILSTVLLYLVIAVYAASLAIQARGQPDQAQIAQFVNQVAPWGGPILAILLTIGGAVWVARKVARGATLHGLLVGLVAAISLLIVGLAFRRLDLVALLTFVLMVAAGWLGGFLGSRGREKSEPSGILPS
jgi:putative membrane protein (TIGR04086 family)